jgi:hypothetical protein
MMNPFLQTHAFGFDDLGRLKMLFDARGRRRPAAMTNSTAAGAVLKRRQSPAAA